MGFFKTKKAWQKNRASRVDRPQWDKSLKKPINFLGAWRVCFLITFSIYLLYHLVIVGKTLIKNKQLFRCPPGTSGIYSVKSPQLYELATCWNYEYLCWVFFLVPKVKAVMPSKKSDQEISKSVFYQTIIPPKIRPKADLNSLFWGPNQTCSDIRQINFKKIFRI